MAERGEEKELLNTAGTKIGMTTLESGFVENNSWTMCIPCGTMSMLLSMERIPETFMHMVRETYIIFRSCFY